MTTTHFTAWLVNDASALETDCCDITVIEDEAISYHVADDGTETPVWGSTGDPLFHAVTTVDAKTGDIEDAIKEAEALMADAGWTTAGGWEAVDNAYIVTVERAEEPAEDIEDSAEETGDGPLVTVADVRALLAAQSEDPVLYVQNGPDDEGGEPTVEVWAGALVPAGSVIVRRSDLDDTLGDDPDDDSIRECLPQMQEDADRIAAEFS